MALTVIGVINLADVILINFYGSLDAAAATVIVTLVSRMLESLAVYRQQKAVTSLFFTGCSDFPCFQR